MTEEVILKKDIRQDKPFENNPNLIFGLICILDAIFCMGSIFVLYSLPFWALMILWVVVIGASIWYIVQKNENANLTKSSAFILRNGILYYLRLGYQLEGDVPMDALNRAQAARARENVRKTSHIQEIRNHESTFSDCLTEILNSPLHTPESNSGIGHLPEYVIQFCEMHEPKLEQQTSRWIWISYENAHTDHQRVTQKFRNVYDLPWDKITCNR